MKVSNEKGNVFKIIDQYTEQAEKIVMGVGLLAISAIVFINVILRYFFEASLVWSEELARYIVVWVTFFGISSCARYNGHVIVDLLPNKLKGNSKYIQGLVVLIISLGLSIYLAYLSVQFTITQFIAGNTSIAIAIPIWIIYLSTAVGFTLMSYVYARKTIKHIMDRKEVSA